MYACMHIGETQRINYSDKKQAHWMHVCEIGNDAN
jgi:hypothetical protein